MMASQKSNAHATPSGRLYARREALLTRVDSMAAHKFVTAHAALVDDYFLASFAQSDVGPRMGIMRNPYALIALGGYGRSEQCVFSDIDLLFLFEKEVPAAAESLVREIVYPLWDIGLEVGHATRSIGECLSLARDDFEVLTSLLDGRFLCGVSPLYHQMTEMVREKLIGSDRRRIISRLHASNRAQHERFGDSSYLLEPNLKEGQGGLRDYHTLLWISKIQSAIKQTPDLKYFGILSHDEYQELTRSLDFIWQVRNQLHLMTQRKCDQLYLENQTRLAEKMKVEGGGGHLPVERLMGKLHGRMEFIKQCYEVFIYGLDKHKLHRRGKKHLKHTRLHGLKFKRGTLNFSSPKAILKDPFLLVKIFLESAVHDAPLNVEAHRLIKDFGYLIGDPSFRNSSEAVRLFEKLLARKGGKFNPLNAMLDTRFLINFLPGFEGVVNRIQFDQYHLYPVARHLLLTVLMLKRIGREKSAERDPLFRQIYSQVRGKKALLWAALLHDIGKAEPVRGHARRGAKMVRILLTAKGLAQAKIDTITFLVQEHLLLFETATRRDIDAEETAIWLARRVGKSSYLKMLYLLSVADAMATGPKAWNTWTATLLRGLFLKTLNVLENGELASPKATRVIEQKKALVRKSVNGTKGDGEPVGVVDDMSPRYLLHTPAREIPAHIRLYEQLGDDSFIWRIEKAAETDQRIVTICAQDRPGLLSKIAGTLTLNNINILDLRIFTWRNNIALDIFVVDAPPDKLFEEERWDAAASQLRAALDGGLDLNEALIQRKRRFRSIQPFTRSRIQKVVVNNVTSSFFTIIEVTAWDYPGLLFRITDALYRCGLNIWVAKVASRVDQVVDVFYVRGLDGEKVNRRQQERMIQQTVEAVLN